MINCAADVPASGQMQINNQARKYLMTFPPRNDTVMIGDRA
jgi:hypothetical protein